MPDEIRGFAGFDSLVSDLSDLPQPTTSAPVPTPKARVVQDDDETALPPAPTKPAPNAGGSMGWWILIAVVVVSLIALSSITSTSNKNPATSSVSNDWPPAPAAPPPSVQLPSQQGPWPKPAPQREPEEMMPPIGTGQTLSASQIRYCLSQSIRIDGASPAVDKTSHTDIDAFNAMVEDYNNRCSNFRYRQGILESVRADVESRRQALESQGYANFVAASKRMPASSVPAVKPGNAQTQSAPAPLSEREMMAALYRGYPGTIGVGGNKPCLQGGCAISLRKTEGWTGQDGKSRKLVVSVVERKGASHSEGATLGIGMFRWDYVTWAEETLTASVMSIGGFGLYVNDVKVLHFPAADPVVVAHDSGMHQGVVDESDSIIMSVSGDYRKVLDIATDHSTGGYCDNTEPSCIKRIQDDDFSSRVSIAQTGDGILEVTQAFTSGGRRAPNSWRISTNGQVKETSKLNSSQSQAPGIGTNANYDEGLSDRRVYESWFSGLTGDTKDGAAFWAEQRSTKKPPSCTDVKPQNAAWTFGCLAAKQQLLPMDAKRKANGDYRRGWNSY